MTYGEVNNIESRWHNITDQDIGEAQNTIQALIAELRIADRLVMELRDKLFEVTIVDAYTLDDGLCTPEERIESMVQHADEARHMSREKLLGLEEARLK